MKSVFFHYKVVYSIAAVRKRCTSRKLLLYRETKPMSIQIQRATIDDLALLAPLFDAYRVFYEQSADLALARHFLEQRLSKQESIIFLALEDAAESTSTSAQQRGLGFVQLYPSFSSVSAQRLWILNDLFVAPHARRRGVAQTLMNRAKDFAIEDGAKGLFLETAHDNHHAQALYESLGYAKNSEYYYFLATHATKT